MRDGKGKSCKDEGGVCEAMGQGDGAKHTVSGGGESGRCVGGRLRVDSHRAQVAVGVVDLDDPGERVAAEGAVGAREQLQAGVAVIVEVKPVQLAAEGEREWCASVASQVDMLVELATDPNVCARQWTGLALWM